jgi:hypothetical protein
VGNPCVRLATPLWSELHFLPPEIMLLEVLVWPSPPRKEAFGGRGGAETGGEAPRNHDSKKKTQKTKVLLKMILASLASTTLLLVLPLVASARGAEAGPNDSSFVGDWMSALACTVDTDGSPSLVDESSCASDATDADGKSCVWCDASSVVGTGLCVSEDVKKMAGQYWDQLCASSSSVGPPPPTPPTPPTPPPTTTPPAPAPDDEFQCTLDSSKNVIKDEVECSAQKDATGTSCEWCNVPIIGGACVTASMKTEFGSICGSGETRGGGKGGGNLRGATTTTTTTTVDDGEDDGGEGLGGKIEDWSQLDPSCLGDSVGGLVNDGDACVARTDKGGKSCVWCDAGAFGICASSDQKDIIGGYLDCDSDDSDADVVAVE